MDAVLRWFFNRPHAGLRLLMVGVLLAGSALLGSLWMVPRPQAASPNHSGPAGKVTPVVIQPRPLVGHIPGKPASKPMPGPRRTLPMPPRPPMPAEDVDPPQQDADPPPAPDPIVPPPPKAPSPPSLIVHHVQQPPQRAQEHVILRTVAGDILLSFFPDAAPESIDHFLHLVRIGAYNTTFFGRAEAGFVMQVYNAQDRLHPLTDEQRDSLQPMKGEFSDIPHRRGVLSFGREDNDPNSAVSSFSILLADAPHLDGKYTLFGCVEKGMDVIDRLMEVPRSARTSPSVRLTIWHAEVVAEHALANLTLEGPRPLADILDQTPPPSLGRRAMGVLQGHCLACHGSKKRGGLDLRAHGGLLRGGDHGPVVYSGNGSSSPLLRRLTGEEKPAMPPSGPRLSLAEVAALTAWVDVGAPYPKSAGGATVEEKNEEKKSRETVTAEDAGLWSFRSFRAAVPPAVKSQGLVRTPVDAFLLARLESRGLSFNPEAGRRTLLRRLYFDLIGLPPGPEDVAVFEEDTSPDAYEKVVERLLASPHYGERWGRHWLDLVRYADSNGYENDENRPLAYAYRDFVIQALQQDMPFDQFLRWQVAGDELAPTNPAAVAATGFATAGPLQTFFMKKKDRYDELDDIVTTMGAAMLGLTVGCARCHDHKFDPIPQRDYYRLQAVFAGSRREERYLVPDGGADYLLQRVPLEHVRRLRDKIRLEYSNRILGERVDVLPISAEEKAVLKLPFDEDNTVQASLLRRFGEKVKVTEDDVRKTLSAEDRAEWEALGADIARLEKVTAPEPPRGLCLGGNGVGRAFFLERGRADMERDLVPPGFLTVLTHDRPVWTNTTWMRWGPPKSADQRALPRSALAYWLTDVEDGAGRLAARVLVNRLWQHHFGEGLVRTPNDFGQQGDRPVHLELLDWLARRLIEGQWQLKDLHRLLVTSTAYRQDTSAAEVKLQIDPDNRLWGRRRPQRLSAEALRDALLTAAGDLNRRCYGPGIKPPLPADAIFPTAPKHGEVWPANVRDGPEVWRRSVYIVTKRSNFVPFLQGFDAPDASASCARRSTTTVPTQALILMNDPFVVTRARRLAESVERLTGPVPEEQVRQAFLHTLSRWPDTLETARAVRFLHDRGGSIEALADLCQVLFQTNEFLYVD